MICKQGHVILIPFPFTDFSTIKQRPAVVISSDEFNNSHQDIIVCAMSSQIPEVIPPEDYLLSPEEIKIAGLPKPTLIRTSKIVTINKLLIHKQLGILPSAAIQKIKSIFLDII